MMDLSSKAKRLAAVEILRARLYAKGFAARFMIYLVAIILSMFGVAMLVVASYLVFSEMYGGPISALLASGIVLVPAILLVAFIGPLSGARERRQADQEARTARNDFNRDKAMMVALLEGWTAGNREKGKPPAKTIALTALVAGLAVGLSPTLRKFLKP